jgi:hypothetical protein
MNLHRAFFVVVLSAAAPVLAQETASTLGTESLGTSSLFAAPVSQDTMVPIKGIVSGSPESVTFSGNAVVKSRLAPDPDFNRPRLVLTIDLTSVAGIGSTSGAKYVISGPEFTQRNLAASHSLEFAFPFKSTKSATAATARTGVASFVLDFDVNTGAVTGASGSVVTPNFPR